MYYGPQRGHQGLYLAEPALTDYSFLFLIVVLALLVIAVVLAFLLRWLIIGVTSRFYCSMNFGCLCRTM